MTDKQDLFVGDDHSDRIRAYWRDRGYTVKAGLRRVSDRGATGKTIGYSAVRSDLVGGLPVGYRGDLGLRRTPPE